MEHEPSDALAELNDVLIQALNLREETEGVVVLDFVYKSKPPVHIVRPYKSLLTPIQNVTAYVNQFQTLEELLSVTTRAVRSTLFNLFSEVDELNVRAKIIAKWPNGFDDGDSFVEPVFPTVPSGKPLPILAS